MKKWLIQCNGAELTIKGDTIKKAIVDITIEQILSHFISAFEWVSEWEIKYDIVNKVASVTVIYEKEKREHSVVLRIQAKETDILGL